MAGSPPGAARQPQGATRQPPRPTSQLGTFARWPTGAKIFLILSVSLLPLALIAIFATLRVTQIANTELRSHLRLGAAESARATAIEMVGDVTALRATVDALKADREDAQSCARVKGVLAQRAAAGIRFVIFDRRNRVLCGRDFPNARMVARDAALGQIGARIMPGQGVVVRVTGVSKGVAAAVYFPAPLLAQVGRPSVFTPDYGAALILGDQRLELVNLPRRQTLERHETQMTPLGFAGLSLEMQVRAAPVGSPLILALLVPLLMWVAAAAIAWFVVDRLLIAPLQSLRGNIAAYSPGDQPDAALYRALPAQEIRELGDTFRALSRTVAIHEAGLAEGLVRQTKLTREVHHRVKNNLQVISSLINFHARGAQSAEASAAYASIQRRVDALAVVHRYHYAEMEENRGVALRAVLGELASNIRATAAEGTRPGITLEVMPVYATQDTAVAVAFLVTELIELAVTCDTEARLTISLRQGEDLARATLRVVSRALCDSDCLRDGLSNRYGRVIEGLTRQLRSTLHHDPLLGAYEIAIGITGSD